MTDSMISNQAITVKSTITTSMWTGSTFQIYETWVVVSNASVVIKNKVNLERFVLNIDTTWLCTIVLRWLMKTVAKVEDIALRKERTNGAQWYVTMLSFDMIDKDTFLGEDKLDSGNNTFIWNNIHNWDETFSNDVIVWWTDAQLDLTNAKMWFNPPYLTQTEINALPTTGTWFVKNSTTWEYNQLIGWVWQPVAAGSTQPNATQIVAGKVRFQTEWEYAQIQDIWNEWTWLVMKPSKTLEMINSKIASQANTFSNSDYLTLEALSIWDSIFLEQYPTFASATIASNIWDLLINEKVSIKAIGSWIAWNEIKLSLAKVGSPDNLNIRIETNNWWVPSWVLLDNSYVFSLNQSLFSTSLTDFSVTVWTNNTNVHWVTLNTNELTQTIYKWVKILLNNQQWCVSITKVAACTATKAYLYDENQNLLFSASFVWNIATINYSQLISWKNYFVLCGSDWASYTSVKQTWLASFPYISSKISFVWWADNTTNDVTLNWNSWGSSDTTQRTNTVTISILKTCKISSAKWNLWTVNATQLLNNLWESLEVSSDWSFKTTLIQWNTYKLVFIWNIVNTSYWSQTWNTNISITAQTYKDLYVIKSVWVPVNNTNINNITQIITNDNILIPYKQIIHFVLTNWVYWSETINKTNFYKLWYNNVDTTNRQMKILTNWAWNNILSEANIPSSVYSGKSLVVTSQDALPDSVQMSLDGTRLYVLWRTNKRVYQYNLSTPYDLSTAVYSTKLFSVNTQETAPTTLSVSRDWTKMYVAWTTNKTIYQYTLVTPFEVDTAVYATKNFSVNAQDTSPQNTVFTDDWTRLFVLWNTGKAVFQYELTTAWDISTAIYATKTFVFTTQDATPIALWFSNNGSRLYMLGTTNKQVYVYGLTTAWDISTSVYLTKVFSVNTQDTAPIWMCFNKTWDIMYICWDTNNTVFQYTIPWNISWFPYLSTTLCEMFAYSKTCALYSYKVWDIPRLSKSTYWVWDLVSYDYLWITKLLLGLTYGVSMYISNTPWLLSSSAWLTSRKIWVALSPIELYLNFISL